MNKFKVFYVLIFLILVMMSGYYKCESLTLDYLIAIMGLFGCFVLLVSLSEKEEKDKVENPEDRYR